MNSLFHGAPFVLERMINRQTIQTCVLGSNFHENGKRKPVILIKNYGDNLLTNIQFYESK